MTLQKLDKPYLDGLIDKLLRPLPSMMASDVEKLMAEAAEVIHRQAKLLEAINSDKESKSL